jgi:hypothetical protein
MNWEWREKKTAVAYCKALSQNLLLRAVKNDEHFSRSPRSHVEHEAGMPHYYYNSLHKKKQIKGFLQTVQYAASGDVLGTMVWFHRNWVKDAYI